MPFWLAIHHAFTEHLRVLVILHSASCHRQAEEIATDLKSAYSGRFELVLTDASAPISLESEVAWDDLLIILFDSRPFPVSGLLFIENYLRRSSHGGMILPVAIEHNHQHPPQPVQELKALDFNETASGIKGQLVRRVGAMLGLRVQSRENQIFISYRTADGQAIANQLFDHLKLIGYEPWLDEARELDGDPKILPGSLVQTEIDAALSKANIVLLVDTPSAPHSLWIKHEIDTANALLLPILPLCFRNADDHSKGPRFRSLRDLQRWVSLNTPFPLGASLNADDLNCIVSEMESYLSEIFRRKCRVPFLVEKEFVSRQFAWRVLDPRLLMFESTKQKSQRVPLKILSHCSVFEHLSTSGLNRLSDFFIRTGRANYALFIYDGEELIPESELNEIIEAHGGPAIILHHQELSTLIDSNFTTLSV